MKDSWKTINIKVAKTPGKKFPRVDLIVEKNEEFDMTISTVLIVDKDEGFSSYRFLDVKEAEDFFELEALRYGGQIIET